MQNNNQLIPTKESEINELTRMSIDAFHSDALIGGEANDGPPDYDNMNWHRTMQKEDHLFSYYVDEVLVGGAVIFKNGNTIYIGRIFIDPRYFKKGYGRGIMNAIHNLYKDVNKFYLDTPIWNIRTNSLYLSLGYKEIKRDEECISYERVV